MFNIKIDKIKIDMAAVKRQIQPALEKAGLEHVEKIAKKTLSADELQKVTIRVVNGRVQMEGPQELLDQVKEALEK